VREVEVKSVVDDLPRRRAAVEAAGAVRTFEGHLGDRRYDTPDLSLAARDHVLRVREYGTADARRVELDWKGPTHHEGGYKVREELDVHVAEPEALDAILDRLGYVVTVAIDRDIIQYELGGAMIRFEHYPRMDDLVEVEGTPEAIERAIAALGLARDGFTSERLPEFVLRFEARTGTSAVLSDDEMRGGARYDPANA
jgi:adenylate cyclase class IV